MKTIKHLDLSVGSQEKNWKGGCSTMVFRVILPGFPAKLVLTSSLMS